jgi:deoxyribodipyrimidine photo-lyase
VNNGNWQWCAGTGENPQDYWRFFSPWKQAMDYDPNCEYIKKWVPELKDLPCNVILKWNEKCEEWKGKTDYPKPIVEFNAELREEVLEMYRDSFQEYKE